VTSASDENRPKSRSLTPQKARGFGMTSLAGGASTRDVGKARVPEGVGREGASAAGATLVRRADCWRTGAGRGLAGDFDEFIVEDIVGGTWFMILGIGAGRWSG
jgi:hypothetical protein